MASDRDLGVAFVRAWAGPGPAARDGWEATAATGVRGLRLLSETGAFRSFRFSDTNDAAVEVLRRNVADRAGASAVREDARRPPPDGPFDYVDVDPYGSPLPYLPAAVAATRPGGVLAVTATDMIVLAGAQRAAAVRRYAAEPVRGRLGPEGGVRILLAVLARRVRAEHRQLRPLLAYALDHHVRAYVRLDAPVGSPDPIGTIDTATWSGPRLDGSGPFGPLWLGPLSDSALVRDLTVPPTAERPRELARFLPRLIEEADVPAPFYYEPNVLAGQLGLARPPSVAALIGALTAAGHRAARTHARPEGIRTDAPRETVEAAARRLGGG